MSKAFERTTIGRIRKSVFFGKMEISLPASKPSETLERAYRASLCAVITDEKWESTPVPFPAGSLTIEP